MERDVFDGKEWNTEKNFNSHAHVERDHHFSTLALYYANFNSHAHVERDDKTTLKGVVGKDFNSHAHVERDWITAWARHELFNFNSHAHVERDNGGLVWYTIYSYFNSHAHVERDIEVKGIKKAIGISTHTLTWSVTFLRATLNGNSLFQLTRSRGA